MTATDSTPPVALPNAVTLTNDTDSSYLFDLMAGDPDAFSKRRELVERGEMQRLPTPVVAETYYGVATARSDATEQEVRNRLLGYPRVEVDNEIAGRRASCLPLQTTT